VPAHPGAQPRIDMVPLKRERLNSLDVAIVASPPDPPPPHGQAIKNREQGEQPAPGCGRTGRGGVSLQRQLLRLQAEPELIVVQARDGAVMIEHAEALAGRPGMISHCVGSVISAGGKGAEKKVG